MKRGDHLRVRRESRRRQRRERIKKRDAAWDTRVDRSRAFGSFAARTKCGGVRSLRRRRPGKSGTFFPSRPGARRVTRAQFRFHEAMTYRVDLQGGVRRGARDRPGAGLRAQRDRAGRHAPARAQSIARRDPRSGSLRVTKEDEKSGGSLCEPDGWRRKRGDDERASDVRFARIEDAGGTRTEAARDIGLLTVLRVRRPASARVTLRSARAPRASPKPRRTESRARTSSK